jgi:hypothetical protein
VNHGPQREPATQLHAPAVAAPSPPATPDVPDADTAAVGLQNVPKVFLATRQSDAVLAVAPGQADRRQPDEGGAP